MRWIAKYAPIYVWKGDTWYHEIEKQEYKADTFRGCWVSPSKLVGFTKKTRVLG